MRFEARARAASSPAHPRGGIAVVGATLAALAAAARLARLGHQVTVLDVASGPSALLPSPLDPDPQSVVLPAAWRDLFRKSGRTLDAELARRGLALLPAPPRRYPAGNDTVELPHDRAGQWHQLSATLGTGAATAWRDLLDRMDTTWQTLRPLGLEAEFTGLDRAARAALRPSETIADLARTLPVPLAGIVHQLAVRRDSEPRRTPGWLATRLAVERTFGVWQVTDADQQPQPAEVLTELLRRRLLERGVDLRWDARITRVRPGMVTADSGIVACQAIILGLNPWRALTVTGKDSVLARSGRRLTRAATAGPRWDGWRTLLALPPLVSGTPGIYLASEFSPAGPEPWAQLLTGALASHRVHFDLTGEDSRPVNKQFRLPHLNARFRPPAG